MSIVLKSDAQRYWIPDVKPTSANNYWTPKIFAGVTAEWERASTIAGRVGASSRTTQVILTVLANRREIDWEIHKGVNFFRRRENADKA